MNLYGSICLIFIIFFISPAYANPFSNSFQSEIIPFIHPIGIAISNLELIYVSDYGNHRVQIFDSDGNFLSSFGSYGSEPGQFDGPHNIAFDDDNQIYVVDWGNPRVQIFSPINIMQNESKIPNWFKNTLNWYIEGKISDNELINALIFLKNCDLKKGN